LFTDNLFLSTRWTRRYLPHIWDREAMIKAVGRIRGKEMSSVKASNAYRYWIESKNAEVEKLLSVKQGRKPVVLPKLKMN
jgi:hypothetical protein